MDKKFAAEVKVDIPIDLKVKVMDQSSPGKNIIVEPYEARMRTNTQDQFTVYDQGALV